MLTIVSSISRLLLFFSSCSRDHRDLHSFPTRRSSDLTGERVGPAMIALQERLMIEGVNVRRPPRHKQKDDTFDHKPLLQRDRKSTRLNSSHTVISYAVFCLKKKKKNNNTSAAIILTMN